MMHKLRALGTLVSTLPQWRPHHLADWAKSWRSARNPLDEGMPWLAWRAIDWLDQVIRPGMRVLEYGGGGSTLYFLSRGCQVTTVEGNIEWANNIRAYAAPFADRLELRYVNSQTDDPLLRAQYAAQAQVGAPWDLVLVDGAFRAECVRAARDCVAPGGFIIVDNTDLPEYADVRAPEVLGGFDRQVYRGFGYARVVSTTTEVYRAATGRAAATA